VSKVLIIFAFLFSTFFQDVRAQDAVKTDLKNVVENFSVIESITQEAGVSPVRCNTKQEGTQAEAEEVKLSVSDCSTAVTDTDLKIIEKILTDIKALKKSNLDAKSAEYKTAYAKIIEGADDALSPAAKGMLATQIFKETFSVPNATKEFKNAFSEFESWAGFHVRSFGPGTDYASLGLMDSVRATIPAELKGIAMGGSTTRSFRMYSDRW
jgi:hypothetical protein